MSFDDEIRSLARAQRAVFTTEQAIKLGATRSVLAHRTKEGEFVRIAPRVFAVAGTPLTADLLLFASWLECGGHSALSHETAAAHWAFPGFRSRPIQLVRFRDGTFPPVSLGRVHTTRVLPETHLVAVDGLRVTTPARTLFDLASRVHPGRLERLIDRAWSDRLVTFCIMHRTLDELRGSGRAGIGVMRELLDCRPADYIAPASGLESRFRTLVRNDGQVEMERQHNIGNEERWIGRVDFVDRKTKVIVEVQSDRHHTSISDQRADELRRKALEEAGWIVLQIREWELWHEGAGVQRKIRNARSGR